MLNGGVKMVLCSQKFGQTSRKRYSILHYLHKGSFWGVFVYLPVSLAYPCADVPKFAK